MIRYRFGSTVIAAAGYDPMTARLEVEFAGNNDLIAYFEVPEDVWYRFKCATKPEDFFHRQIKGCYEEKGILREVS